MGWGHGQWRQLSDHLDWCVSVVEEGDPQDQHTLIEISLKMTYTPLLRSPMSLLIFPYLGNVLTIKACQNANKFNRIWSPFMKQVLSLQREGLNLGPRSSVSTQDTPCKNQSDPAPLHFKVL